VCELNSSLRQGQTSKNFQTDAGRRAIAWKRFRKLLQILLKLHQIEHELTQIRQILHQMEQKMFKVASKISKNDSFCSKLN